MPATSEPVPVTAVAQLDTRLAGYVRGWAGPIQLPSDPEGLRTLRNPVSGRVPIERTIWSVARLGPIARSYRADLGVADRSTYTPACD